MNNIVQWGKRIPSFLGSYHNGVTIVCQKLKSGPLRNVWTGTGGFVYRDWYQYDCYPKSDIQFDPVKLMPPHYVSFVGVRRYVKGKNRVKSDKGKMKIEINEDLLSQVIKVDVLKKKMQKAVDDLKEDYIKTLSLRSTTGTIETLEVTFEGKEYSLQELAQIVRKNPKTLIINMSVFPQAIPAVLESIKRSGMNLNPQQDGTTIYIPIPKVTKEHRENLAKNAKVLFVKCKDAIKDTQNKYLKSVKNNTNISEDLSHDLQNQIVTLGQQYVSGADKIFESKRAELIGKD